MVSFMIKAKSLDPSLEVKAISSATHILNRSPHPTLDGKTPFEAWCCRKPNVTHFRVFGCPAWANKSCKGYKAQFPRPCTFIGYADSVKAYRLLDPKIHQIFVENDVHFEESSPSLSSNPLHDSYIVETDTDNSDSDSTISLVRDPSDRQRKRSQHKKIPHAYIAIVIGPCNSIQLGTPCLLVPKSGDDYLTYISSLFVEPHIADLRDILVDFRDVFDDLHLLFDEENTSPVVVRAHSNPHVHSLHDQSSQVDVIVDPYVHQL